ncbi:hypothetical protein SUGI_1167870 [Cryptomeria japonica]|nr:hypothetical protein SUGI_1167870 [Cryptomeria japonica]
MEICGNKPSFGKLILKAPLLSQRLMFAEGICSGLIKNTFFGMHNFWGTLFWEIRGRGSISLDPKWVLCDFKGVTNGMLLGSSKFKATGKFKSAKINGVCISKRHR